MESRESLAVAVACGKAEMTAVVPNDREAVAEGRPDMTDV